MRKVFLFLPIWLMLMAGCTPDKDQFQHGLDSILEDVQNQEKDIADIDNQLKDLEKKEQALFSKTVELNIEDREALESNVLRLRTLLDEREDLLDDEDKAILAAQEASEQLRDLPQSETEKGTQAAADLKAALEKRYDLHHQVAVTYRELLEKQREVYDLLIDENVKRVQLEESVAEVNEQRGKLTDTIRVFNQSTQEVNSALEETQKTEE
ncbi:YkyA family protein [Sporosarcina trichiuri]|uniref:YkyA family protein n=1 Tax=Sporosarcina trichiuri TaxID=3056445 RepID=UPI0025B400D3|nr:YkyA family protein [Sporosarcina sp. 0.2-SM1T-5]WJY28867.1 YkyA family protein [Sporosarcina sp. 0.2-SM1T-5]